MQSVPAMAAMSVLITLIGGGLYAVDKYIDPRVRAIVPCII